MAIYECYECLQYRDGDWFPCNEHPETGEMVCEDCLPTFVEPEEREYNSDCKIDNMEFDEWYDSLPTEEETDCEASFGSEGWFGRKE